MYSRWAGKKKKKKRAGLDVDDILGFGIWDVAEERGVCVEVIVSAIFS